MSAVLLALLPPWLAGYAMVRWAWPLPPSPWRTLFRISLATGLAIGFSSISYFLWAMLVGPELPGLPIAELIVFAALLLLFVRVANADPVLLDNRGLPPSVRLRLIFFFLLLCTVVRSGWYLWHSPHGDWDAWAIWNLRARFLFRGGEDWRAAFSPLIPWSHPDYPLLLPTAVARGWSYAGQETPAVPSLIACLFGAATLGLLMSVLAQLRNPRQGYLGGLMLLAAPYFIELMTAQYADVPLGFYFLASAALFEIHDQQGGEGVRLPLLAGVLTGLAAWTKNEGSLFLVAVLVLRLTSAVRRPRRTAARDLIAFTLGLLPVLLVLLLFKLRLAPANDLVAGQGWQATRERLLSPLRYLIILGFFAAATVYIGPGLVVLLGIYRALLGRSPRQREHPHLLHALTLLILLLAGYAFVYLTTPNELAWHLYDSVHRLFMQLWPTALLAFFLATADLEETQQPAASLRL